MFKKIIISLFASLFLVNIANSRDQIYVVGSSTVYPFATVVAENFKKTGYKVPKIESTGSGGGMKLFVRD